MKLLVIDNMLSGLGNGSVYDYIRSFMGDGDEVVIRSSDGTTDIRTFLYDAEDYDMIVASGGDGTIASMAYLLADTGIPLLPFPAGTANLLSLNLESPTEIHAIEKMTREFKTMDFDLGEIEFANGTRQGFTLIAGAGFDAKIMEDAEQGKKMFGQMAYFTSAFVNAMPQFAEFELTIDGKTVRSSGVGVLVINFSKVQFDISVVHENEPRDGKFDIVVLNTKDAIGLIPALFAAILDRSGDFPTRAGAFEVFRGSEVTVVSDPPLSIQFDGEATGLSTPFRARLLPKAARYVVTAECMRLYE